MVSDGAQEREEEEKEVMVGNFCLKKITFTPVHVSVHTHIVTHTEKSCPMTTISFMGTYV